jgi:hypothetical protein
MTSDDETRLYHATVLVTRTEEWCVEAKSPEDAKARLEKGEGHRFASGEIFCVEFGDLSSSAS